MIKAEGKTTVIVNQRIAVFVMRDRALRDTSTFREFPKCRNDYFFRPSRRRSSLDEIAPSFFVRDRERSMIARNLRFVLRDTVSSSAFRIGTTAAKGLPFFTTITGSFLAFFGRTLITAPRPSLVQSWS